MAFSEHELLTFKRVQKELKKIKGGMTVESEGPLAEALGQLGCFPYAKVPCDFDYEFSVAGKPAGTFEKPDVDLILQESTVSSFGKGETTVLDPTYRNGKEIPARNMDISKHDYFCRTSEDEISAAMFIGKTVTLKLYKLAVYEEGGHFDWHMDSTHSDQHHATLLLALNTLWEGGDLKLRRNGVETVVDMHPKAAVGDEDINLQAVAFYTDTEHKVEPVTKGIRIVLQYDVEVIGWRGNAKSFGKGKDEYQLFNDVERISRKRKRYQKSSDSLTADNETVKKVTDIITGLLADGEEEVAFAMQYLYRKSSILPEFLKGADAQLHEALVSSFDVTLGPVVLQSRTDYEGTFKSCVAIPWDQEGTKSDPTVESNSKSENDEPFDSGSEDDEDDPYYSYYSESKHEPKKGLKFHLPLISAIRKISYQEYLEYTGNEAQLGDKKYFGGGMFVRQKKVAKKQ